MGAGENLSVCDLDLSAITWGFPAAGKISCWSLEAAAGLASSSRQFPAQSGSIRLKKKISQTLKCIHSPDIIFIQRHFFSCMRVMLCRALQPFYISSFFLRFLYLLECPKYTFGTGVAMCHNIGQWDIRGFLWGMWERLYFSEPDAWASVCLTIS